MKRWIVITTVLVSLVQLGVLGHRIYALESTLAHGERHLFRTAPVDPYDPFRGRYVRLSEESLRFKVDKGEPHYRGEKVWVSIVREEDGFSRFAGLTGEEDPAPKVRARIRYESGDEVVIEPPFSRFYMNEKKAPDAERAYRRASGRTERNAQIAVRVMDGYGVIEDLYIEGKPVDEFLREEAKRP